MLTMRRRCATPALSSIGVGVRLPFTRTARRPCSHDHGDVIITGAFSGSANFGGGSLTSAGSTDIFVAAFTGAGAHAWSKRFGDAREQRALGIDIDSDGAAYVTGDIQGTADFGGGVLTSAGGRDHFVTKLDATGAHVFSKRLGGAGEGKLHGAAREGAAAGDRR